MDINLSSANIPFDKNIDVAANELFLRVTINRNLEKLLQNDITLAKKIEQQGTTDNFAIQFYKDTRIYNKDDIVLYYEYEADNNTIDNIYILQSLSNDNATQPRYEIIDSYIKDFNKSGWKDINPLFSIYNSNTPSVDIASCLDDAILNKFYLSHEMDLDYHKFGELTESNLSSKILLKDISNISDKRNQLFFPYENGSVSSDNLSGTYKKWGNGVLEYNLTFKLGDIFQKEMIIDENGDVKELSYIKVNSLIPLSSDEFNNDDYFLNESAYSIFNKNGTTDKYKLNDTYQTNINDKVNTYHCNLEFPIHFIDSNYMIFYNTPTLNSSGISQSINTLSFINRKNESITVVYIIPNYNNKPIENVLLQNNLFQCQIIGRWKN